MVSRWYDTLDEWCSTLPGRYRQKCRLNTFSDCARTGSRGYTWTAFIDGYKKQIELLHHFIVSRKEKPTPMLASLLSNVASHLFPWQTWYGDRHICTVVIARTIPPSSQALVTIRTRGLRTYILQSVEHMRQRRRNVSLLEESLKALQTCPL